MEQFEKVEKLRVRAGISYEEAKEALEANDWDLLDAMIWLEKQGKVSAPEQESYSTQTENEEQMFSVQDMIKQSEYKVTVSKVRNVPLRCNLCRVLSCRPGPRRSAGTRSARARALARRCRA